MSESDRIKLLFEKKELWMIFGSYTLGEPPGHFRGHLKKYFLADYD